MASASTVQKSESFSIAGDMSRNGHVSEVAAYYRSAWRPLATILVGSQARGIETPDSDIDLAFILPEYDGPQLIEENRSGVTVGLERYSAGQFLSLPDVPLLDFKELREAGRLAEGIVLYSEWEKLPVVRQRWRAAVLNHQDAFELFYTAAENLHPLAWPLKRTSEDQVWKVQGALGALCTMALNLSPLRFQKPKWVVHDLQLQGHKGLVSLIRRSFGAGKRLSRDQARAMVNDAGEHLDAGFRLGRFHQNGDPKQCKTLDFVRFTFRGALGLIETGDYLGGVYTAMSALRVLHSKFVESPAQPNPRAITRWRNRMLRALLPEESFESWRLIGLEKELRTVGRDLQEQYKLQHARAMETTTECT